MNKKIIYVIIISTLLIVAAIYLAWLVTSNISTNQNNNGEITNFAECEAAGNRVQESYPARCITEDGRSFIQPIQ